MEREGREEEEDGVSVACVTSDVMSCTDCFTAVLSSVRVQVCIGDRRLVRVHSGVSCSGERGERGGEGGEGRGEECDSSRAEEGVARCSVLRVKWSGVERETVSQWQLTLTRLDSDHPVTDGTRHTQATRYNTHDDTHNTAHNKYTKFS